MLPATITKIHQAFKESKHMAIDTWQEECCLAARQAMKEVLETRMHLRKIPLRNCNVTAVFI